ncbi:MAG: drug/metabolite transporter (DMT)-like permease [Bacteroidia bacterium]|jgi:drug/metabolite transporter (DMT)-like permease
MTYGVRMMIWAGLTFAMMNVAVKLLPGIPSSEIVFFRAMVSLVLSAYLVRRKRISFFGTNRSVLLLRGLFGTTALMFFFYTLQVMPLASSMVIHYLAPIFTALIAHFFLKERLKAIQFLFFLLSFAGIVVMKGFDERLDWMDVVAGVLAALFSGAAYNCIRKLKFSEDSQVIILYFPMVAFPITLAYTLLGPGWVWPSTQELGLLVLIGVLTQIAQYFLTRAFQSELANKVAAVSNLGVIYALVIGYLIFAETFSKWSIIGMTLVVIGVILNVFVKPKVQPT